MSDKALVILAAGMGSRYGGLKQIDSVGPNGEIIMDYSLYDAKRAGFNKAVFIIKRELEADFEEKVYSKIRKHFDIVSVYQELSDIPENVKLDPARVKPLGTAHALLAARNVLDLPFAVINADDYYGPGAFDDLSRFLDGEKYIDGVLQSAAVSYILKNTLSKFGHVARGICKSKADGKSLESIRELKMIKAGDSADKAVYSLDGGESWQEISADSMCSMNFWGFYPEIFKVLQEESVGFYEKELPADRLKAEYLLPEAIERAIRKDKLRVEILPCKEEWIGMTYKEDKPYVKQAIAEKHAAGIYPADLWA